MFQIDLNHSGGVIVHFASEHTKLASDLFDLAKKRSSFTGKKGDLFYLPNLKGPGELLVGLGNLKELSLEDLRSLAYEMAKILHEAKEESVEIKLSDIEVFEEKERMLALAEGFLQANYSYSAKSTKDDQRDIKVHFSSYTTSEQALEHALEDLKYILEGVFLARDLVNTTSNEIYPESLAAKAREKLLDLDVEVEVLAEDEIRKLGMEAFLSVAQGSSRGPRLIVMRYKGSKENEEKTALVGKGITYDSGGYCLKPADSMASMHSDMAGAATVIGSIYALAKMQAKTNVIGVVAACENLISGHAYKTGDIIGSMAGKSIEVVNTDAEGRLTLADALYYATSQEGVKRVIDIATLTGAALIALGEEYTGVITNDQNFYEDLFKAAEAVGEAVWQLPSNERLKKMNEGKRADLTNSAGRFAGTVTAGLFVGEFLAESEMPWIHMDIAGTSYLSKARSYLPEGATGYHVKTFVQLLTDV